MRIPDERFIFYADYFAMAAEAGLESARSIFNAYTAAVLVNFNTVTNRQTAAKDRNDLAMTLRTTYDLVLINAVALQPMREAFVFLAAHIKRFTGNNIDDYLTAQGIQVDRTYANIANITGEIVSETNIR